MSVRVRFAPSPTGFLHVGGLRTALYNYLFAKHHNGKFILRIEDTDRTRLVEDAQENLIKSLSWAGLEFDEGPHVGGDFGPYIQSERFDLYKKYAYELIDNGSAYYAFDTSEEIEAMRERQKNSGLAPKYDRTTMKNFFTLGAEETKKLIEAGIEYVIRLKVDYNEEVKFSDVIRGEVKVFGKDIDDQILLKSDGFPTYHLANVVDDHLMEITHVIRGEEWLPSTPKHVLLYKAFGWTAPTFAHLPLLLNEDKSKLSKRTGSVSVEEFNQAGYLKEAFVNFIALLGWNPTNNREIFTIDELIAEFNLEKVNKAGAVFDREKLLWVQGQYFRSMDVNYLVKLYKESHVNEFEQEYIAKVFNLLRERIHFLHELPVFGDYMFGKPNYDKEYYAKCWKETTSETAKELFSALFALEEFTHDPIENAVKTYINEKKMKFGEIMNPLRLVLTGKAVGASLYETMALLGKAECEARMNEFFVKLDSGYFN